MTDPVADYLDTLELALEDLPRSERRDLVASIAQHIDDLREETGAQTEADVRNVLERVGDPDEIAAEAFAGRPVAVERAVAGAPRDLPRRDVAALVLLLVGGVFLPVLGWLAGVALLWSSTTWTAGQKVLGTLVVPGGWAFPLFAVMGISVFPGGGTETCVSGSGIEGTVCTGGPSGLEEAFFWIVFWAAIVASPIVIARLARVGRDRVRAADRVQRAA